MGDGTSLVERWDRLPVGARTALTAQWAGLAAGGLPCGAAVVDRSDRVIAVGRNHVYEPSGPLASRSTAPLQASRLAHAELNALAQVEASRDHGELTIWTTQHPCPMCAAAIRFCGIGSVRYIADDPSDDADPATVFASRLGIPTEPLDAPYWWLVANVLFLADGAARDGASDGNMQLTEDRFPVLFALSLQLAAEDALGNAARSGYGLVDALVPHHDDVAAAASGLIQRGSEASL